MEQLIVAKVEKVQNKNNKGYHFQLTLNFDGTVIYINDFKTSKIAYFVMKKNEKNKENKE